MAGTKEFVQDYGNTPFEEYPFSTIDALALCEVFYMPLEMVVSDSFDKKPVNFSEACDSLFRLRGSKHKGLGLMITATPSKNLMLMASKKRYSEMKITAVKEVFSVSPAIQFCAGTFILPDGTLVVCFRGTDDSIPGWREDFDLLLRKGTPAYDIALDYVEKLASVYEGDIILCGHSKGGNLSLHTALCCSKKVRARIKGIYNNEGPGFYNNDIYKTGAYDEILPVYKHYVPTDSMIGMMLAHDYDYEVVKSTKHIGCFQHDVGTWIVENGELVTAPDTDTLSKITDVLLAKVAFKVSNGFAQTVDDVFTTVLEGVDKITLSDFANDAIGAIKGGVDAWKSIDPDTKEMFKSAFRGTGKEIKNAVKVIKNNAVKETTELCFSFIK